MKGRGMSYGVNGVLPGRSLAVSADTRYEADEQAKLAREQGWREVTVSVSAGSCHSPMASPVTGFSETSPVCALSRGHRGWHEVNDGTLTWRDDDPAHLRAALAEQVEWDRGLKRRG